MQELEIAAAIEINELHREARGNAETAVECAIRCGALLAETKKEGKRDGSIPHGEWQAWVERNCDFSYQSAALYIKASKQKSNALDFSAIRKLYGSSEEKESQHSKEPEPLPENGCEVGDLDGCSTQFGTIYADPPWLYGNQGTRAATGNHYDGMTVEELCEMPIERLAAEKSHLHLWTTNGFLPEAFKVMEAWGFDYKSCFVWVKPQMGIGNYWRVSHEFMLLGTRGSPVFIDKSLMSWASFNRTKHSAKPDEIRRMIERASPGPYLELFARRLSPNWVSWGNEIERTMFEQEVERV